MQRPADIPATPAVAAPPRVPLGALIAIAALTPFGMNVLVPALPAMQRAFSTTYGRVQLTVSLFIAAIAAAQIVIGPLSDRYGRRPVLIVALVIFTCASVSAPFAPTIDALIALRVLQGATGCAGLVIGRAIVRDMFDRSKSASVLGYITMAYAVAPMVAPFGGGVLLEGFGWQAIFWFMALFGAICVAVVWRFVAETNLEPASSLSFGTLFSNYRQLLSSPDFLLFSLTTSTGTGVFFAFLGGGPYVSEHILGLSPIHYGLWFALAAIGYSLGNFISGRFAERVGVTRMILIGCVSAATGATLPPVLFAAGYGSAAALFIPMGITGMSNGMLLPSGIAGAISVFPRIAGAAAGLTGAMQMGYGAGLSALVGWLLGSGDSPYPLFFVQMASSWTAIVIAVFLYRRNRRRVG